jgi:type I site-specific restriction endonuclease
MTKECHYDGWNPDDIKNENEKEEDDAWAAFGSDIDDTEENENEDDDDGDNNHVVKHNDDMVMSMMDKEIDPARDGIGNSNSISSSKSNSSSTTIKHFS